MKGELHVCGRIALQKSDKHSCWPCPTVRYTVRLSSTFSSDVNVPGFRTDPVDLGGKSGAVAHIARPELWATGYALCTTHWSKLIVNQPQLQCTKRSSPKMSAKFGCHIYKSQLDNIASRCSLTVNTTSTDTAFQSHGQQHTCVLKA